jgi:tRNA modification GTPase
MYQDTIAAISTPLGEGGVGIVRLSGQEARLIVEKIFPSRLANRHLVYGHIIDPESDKVVDEVLVSYMAAPHTYTTEDVVEINCHGGPLPLQYILELALRYGARLAYPGEFTLRAFLNGRIDLAQAEAVLDVIRAKTQAGLRFAVNGLQGRLSARIKAIRTQLMPILAYLTARIDFPEDEVEEQEVMEPLSQAIDSLRQLIATADNGIIYRQGVRTAIVGRPNVGKSSLLNRLLREDRCIVTPIPGTTRDTVEEMINLRGVPFVLVDTAGITHSSKNAVEALGVERSRKVIEQADLVLLVIDASEPLTADDRQIMGLLQDKVILVTANKCDLPCQAEITELPAKVVFTCALNGEGIEELEQQMVSTALGGKVFTSDVPVVCNPRHKDALGRAERYLSSALSSLKAGLPDDFITIDLTAALNALGEITGETVQHDLLETIFSQFCIGK